MLSSQLGKIIKAFDMATRWPISTPNKRNETQDREKTQRIALQEREITERKRGLMGSGNEGTTNIGSAGAL